MQMKSLKDFKGRWLILRVLWTSWITAAGVWWGEFSFYFHIQWQNKSFNTRCFTWINTILVSFLVNPCLLLYTLQNVGLFSTLCWVNTVFPHQQCHSRAHRGVVHHMTSDILTDRKTHCSVLQPVTQKLIHISQLHSLIAQPRSTCASSLTS